MNDNNIPKDCEGFWHYLDGPIPVGDNGEGEYYIHGLDFTENEFNWLVRNYSFIQIKTCCKDNSLDWIEITDEKLKVEFELKFK